jgi:hypothetical protein
MSSLVDKYIDQLATKLIQRGKELVKEAIDTRDYTHRTYNLHDSYGAGVYYQGKLKKVYYNTPKQADKPKKFYGKEYKGSEEIKKALNEYKPNSNGLVLIIIATMPYADILEHEKGSLKRKYRVISQISSMATFVAGEFNGKVNTIGL